MAGKNENAPMTIEVTLAVTIEDPSEWTATFGVEGRKAILGEVRSYVTEHLENVNLGALSNGEVRSKVEVFRVLSKP